MISYHITMLLPCYIATSMALINHRGGVRVWLMERGQILLVSKTFSAHGRAGKIYEPPHLAMSQV
jgi:hypothetical protein